jgi:endoglucanase
MSRNGARSNSSNNWIVMVAPIALVLYACSFGFAGEVIAKASGDAPAAKAQPLSSSRSGDDQANNQGKPRVVDLGLVAPDIIAVTVRAGVIVHGEHVPYHEQAGDRINRDKRHRAIFRDGVYLGTLVGRDQNVIHTADRFVGDRLPIEAIDSPDMYLISSEDDLSYASAKHPIRVARKTKPVDIALGRWESATESVLYLVLPHALIEGKSYRTEFKIGNFSPVDFRYDVHRLRSDAIHVSQVGFHPDDPAKVAFLSTWMGSAGPLDYREGLAFSIVRADTDAIVYEGRTTLAKRLTEGEDASGRNFNGTNVYLMQFDSLNEEGEYFVVVEGVGRSYPFEISRNAWRQAFHVAARGFYHQRSGIELGPPYTTFRRPRPFHPADGMQVYQSTCPLMKSGNGLSYGAKKKNNFDCLVKGKLDQTVPEAWGGYMDAGDWDRRVQHLRVSRHLLELTEMFPQHFSALTLNIPEEHPDLPDVVSEALFNLDFYRRMQAPDGGGRGGVESSEHPRRGEASWDESLDVMAYAPDIWSSHWYAGVAARAALFLRETDPDLAANYERSATAAMEYAEGRWPELGKPKAQAQGVIDARNLAAAELYRLTGEKRWQDVFLSTTIFTSPEAPLSRWPDFDQGDAAWVYVQSTNPDVDRGIQNHCRQAILREADARVLQATKTGFRWTRNRSAKAAWGAFSVPDGIALARAHRLTGNEVYLRTLILASQYGAGANPLNMSYTTGIGIRYPQHPLHIDSRVSGQPAPAGLTVFGPLGFKEGKGQWGQSLADPFLFPPFERWPTTEAYWDIHIYGPMNEYSVHNSMAKNAYVWGYLSAVRRR